MAPADNSADLENFGSQLQGEELEQLAVNVIRGLSMDAVQKADSGHPGMPMGAADMAYVLWMKLLSHNPSDPKWINRDRFVLSAGHGSMLLYSLLHLSGYDLSLDDIRRFRQWGGITAGHPEYGLAPGVETTTGPLGQGFANGVGMAFAERWLREMFVADGWSPIDHYVYAIVSDGDLMEGISSEAASLAGCWGLGRIVYLYDDNKITIEGSTELTFTEDVAARFRALEWHVQKVDGHNRAEVERAIKRARRNKAKPSLIVARTHIAYGSPGKQDSESSHGAPLGEDEVRLAKEKLGLPADERFFVPRVVTEHFARRAKQLKNACKRWRKRYEDWRRANPDKAELFDFVMDGDIPAGLEKRLPSFQPGEKLATRKASGAILQELSAALPQLVGGSADLGPSNNTLIKGAESVCKASFRGKNVHFGVREHSMAGILNGMALHGGLIPYGGTFLIFSDYMRPSIRLAAMMGLRVIYVFTHDSIYLGEDGPTHQPVEQLMALRGIPNLRIFRPSDAEEVKVAWVEALKRKDGPTALVLTRQGVPVLDRADLAPAEGLTRGAYVIKKETRSPADALIMASGSEVHVSLEAAKKLESEGKSVRVVAAPSLELFEAQPEDYRNSVVPPEVLCRISVEAGRTNCWRAYVNPFGASIGVDRFGASAPSAVLGEKFGFTADNIAEVVRQKLAELPDKVNKYNTILNMI